VSSGASAVNVTSFRGAGLSPCRWAGPVFNTTMGTVSLPSATDRTNAAACGTALTNPCAPAGSAFFRRVPARPARDRW
jgi:hypothetical protein